MHYYDFNLFLVSCAAFKILASAQIKRHRAIRRHGGARISAAKQGSGQTSQRRCHSRLCSVASGPFHRLSTAATVPPTDSYCSHVKRGRATFIRGEIWRSNAAAQQQGSSGSKLRPGQD